MHLIVSEADVAAPRRSARRALQAQSICSTSGFAYDEMLAFRRWSRVPVYPVDMVKHRSSRATWPNGPASHTLRLKRSSYGRCAGLAPVALRIGPAMTRVVSHFTEERMSGERRGW
jgi:hypothetical protein